MVTLNATAESLSIAGILLETSFAQLLNWTWPDIYIASTMKTVCIAFLSLFSTATVLRAQNIVLTNDDGWAVAQIRAQFNALATESDFNVRRGERSTAAWWLNCGGLFAGRVVCTRSGSVRHGLVDIDADAANGAVRIQFVPDRFSRPGLQC